MSKNEFLRYACPLNPHLHSVNCSFSGSASLELHLFIHPHMDCVAGFARPK